MKGVNGSMGAVKKRKQDNEIKKEITRSKRSMHKVLGN